MARRSLIPHWLWLACGLLVANPLWALGLGNIQVSSHLDEPFRAVIPLHLDSASDLNGLTVTLASPAAFQRAGVEMSDALSSLTFKVSGEGSSARVEVSGPQPVREPFLNFLVEAQWNGGALMREYTVLLDPPGTSHSAVTSASTPASSSAPALTPPAAESDVATASSAAAAPTAAPVAMTAPKVTPRHKAPTHKALTRKAVTKPDAVAEEAGSASVDGQRYGPVKPGETFWSIAKKVLPASDVSMNQALLAIYNANPSAFDHGDFNGLMKGVTLTIPSAEMMRATSEAEAQREVTALRHHTAEATPTASSPKTALQAAAPSTTPSPVPAATPAPAPVASAPVEPVPSGAGAAAAVTAAPAAATSAAAAKMPKPMASSSAAPPAKVSSVASAAPASSVKLATAPVQSAAPTSTTPATTPVKPVKPVKVMPAKVGGASGGSLLEMIGRWRTTLLGLLAVIVLLVLLLLRRRQRVEPMPAAPVAAKPAPTEKPAASPTRPETVAPVGVVAPEPERPAAPPAVTEVDDNDDFHTPSAPAFSAGAGLGEGFDAAATSTPAAVGLGGEADDPLREAEFHLAYGLHDEAINILQTALAHEPERVDLKLKLAESYAAAGRSVDFETLAESLKGKVTDAQWDELAEAGRRLNPGAELFDAAAKDVAAPAPQPPSPAPQRDVPGDNIIAFEPEVAAPKSSAPPPPTPPPATPPSPSPAKPATPASTDLSDFDTFGERTPSPGGDNRLDFKLDAIDLSEPAPEVGKRDTPPPAAAEVRETPAASDDEFATKLDLARAYSDMGDNEAAHSLLDEVVNGGSVTQREEAEALKRQLAG